MYSISGEDLGSGMRWWEAVFVVIIVFGLPFAILFT